MMTQPGWQDAAIQDLMEWLAQNESVLALAGFGTVAQAQQDLWSDIDLLLVVEEAAKGSFHPAIDWLAPLGELYCTNQSAHPFASVTRAVFRDFRRIDFVITTEDGLEHAEDWPGVPFWKGTRTLFSRSPRVDRVLAKTFESPQPGLMTADQFQTMANDFWFKGTLAITKVMRNDLLIALHLALEMVQDCCVLGMLLRDRSEGTAHHRHGGIGNDVVVRLDPTRQPFTALGILETLEQSAMAFDQLAARWLECYHEQRHPLLDWIQSARLIRTGKEVAP
jgi:predicted nucleotidyltransferase